MYLFKIIYEIIKKNPKEAKEKKSRKEEQRIRKTNTKQIVR